MNRHSRDYTRSPQLSSSPTDFSRRSRSHYTSSPLFDSSDRLKTADRRAKDTISDHASLDEGKRMSMVGKTKNGLLAQMIHDEFLCCKICLEGFTNPKSLNCLHTFCEDCIESHANSEGSYKKYSDYREFTCPLCRKRTTLPLGGVRKLPDNFLVSSLTEVIDRQKPSKYPFCDICKLVSRKHSEASSKCLDCNKLLCKDCVEQHLDTKVTKNHNIFDVEIEKEIECKEHSDEAVRFYCETCETAICILCTFNDHRNHDVAQFSDAVQKYKGNIEGLLSNCKNKLEQLESQLAIIGKCETTIRGAEEKIKHISLDMISEIKNREKVLIEEIHNIYGPETMSLIESKDDLQANHDALQSTVKLTDLVVKGKDMELLLLKKEVQNKLEMLGQAAIGDLPRTASKVIQYVPGMLDMGYIHDNDRPLLSAARRAHSYNEGQNIFDIDDYISTTETQTDVSMGSQREVCTNTKAIVTTDSETQTETMSETYHAMVMHEAAAALEMPHRSRYTVHQGSLDSNSSYVRTSLDDETTSQRRRRRRERARTTRGDPEKYSYPSDSTASGDDS
ncbi:E3 ubiquitin-protein ligase TRIM56-like isoform X2 [Watersipora subatra]|uniref:E3 ubiquitin-protein ligase TRIM56-like isoform X2 n=1 Tax=Watersipora subatra TaxID=2589382 RepID=UPI00355BF3DE